MNSEYERPGLITTLTRELDEVRNALRLAESAAAAAMDERDVLARWKKEALVYMRKWDAVDEAVREHPDAIAGHNVSDTALRFIRERDEARQQLEASAINTNVRLFDLVRYSRASLHENELITDEEYYWLCGGAEMANSPKGGSPSPRRLEDYDEIRKQLEAMRATVIATEAYQAGLAADNEAMREDIGVVYAALLEAHDRSKPENQNGASLFHVHQKAKKALAKLQPFLKP